MFFDGLGKPLVNRLRCPESKPTIHTGVNLRAFCQKSPYRFPVHIQRSALPPAEVTQEIRVPDCVSLGDRLVSLFCVFGVFHQVHDMMPFAMSAALIVLSRVTMSSACA